MARQHASLLGSYSFSIGLVALLLAIGALYLPGLDGPFLLDDPVNIPQTQLPDLTLDAILHTMSSNHSGIFGRPISTLSFVLNGSWIGIEPYHYKLVNLTLHAINTLLAALLARGLLTVWAQESSTPISYRTSNGLALLCAATWALHPLQVSTVLYAFQRVMLLSTTFALASLLVYLSGRIALDRERTTRAMLTLFVVFPITLALAIFSKENGSLAVGYVLLIEMGLFRFRTVGRPSALVLRTFLGAFVALPIVLAVVFFFTHGDAILEGYGNRDWSMSERLLTETTVLVFYLKLILFPSLDSLTFYHDAYPVVRTLTLWVVLCGALLTALALFVFARPRRWAIASLGAGIFLAAHVLESTVVPLELVFEHRNYFALFGVVLLVAGLAYDVATRTNHIKSALVLGCAGIALLGFQTHTRAIEWSNGILLNTLAVENQPDSLRARSALVVSLNTAGRHREAIAHLRAAQEIAPDDAALAVEIHHTHCLAGSFDTDSHAIAKAMLERSTLSQHEVNSLGNLVRSQLAGLCPDLTRDTVAELYEAAVLNTDKRMPNLSRAVLLAQYADLERTLGRLANAASALDAAMTLKPDYAAIVFLRARVLLELGEFDDFLTVLDHLDSLSARRGGAYDRRIASLRQDAMRRSEAPRQGGTAGS